MKSKGNTTDSGEYSEKEEYKGKMSPKSRASIIFHEFYEIVRRTLDKCGYEESHKDANAEEAVLPKNDSRKSKHPGVAN